MALRAHGPGGTAAPGSARDPRGRGGDRSGGTRPCSPGRARAGRCRSTERGPTARGRGAASGGPRADRRRGGAGRSGGRGDRRTVTRTRAGPRSEEHTSELQSRFDLVCRLLLEKKKKKNTGKPISSYLGRAFTNKCQGLRTKIMKLPHIACQRPLSQAKLADR